MELWDYDLTYGEGGRALFRQCEARDRCAHSYPCHGVVLTRCGGAAMRGVTWEGRVEGKHSALLCDAHTLAYLGPFITKTEDL